MSNQNNRGAVMPPPPVQVDNGVKPVGVDDSAKDNEVDTSEVKVQLGDQAPHSSVVVKATPSGIMVTPIQKGFYGGLRRNPEEKNNKFMIKNENEWGTWMKCDDAKLQAKLVLNHKQKMEKIRQQSNKM